MCTLQHLRADRMTLTKRQLHIGSKHIGKGGDLQNRQQKKKTRVQRSKKQTNIERYVRERYVNDNGTGHTITTSLEGTNIRVMMQNPRGVMKGNKNNGGKRDGHLDLTHLLQMKDLEVDILGLPETNLNWRNAHIRAQW